MKILKDHLMLLRKDDADWATWKKYPEARNINGVRMEPAWVMVYQEVERVVMLRITDAVLEQVKSHMWRMK